MRHQKPTMEGAGTLDHCGVASLLLASGQGRDLVGSGEGFRWIFVTQFWCRSFFLWISAEVSFEPQKNPSWFHGHSTKTHPDAFWIFTYVRKRRFPIVNVFLRFKPWQVNFSYLIHVIFCIFPYVFYHKKIHQSCTRWWFQIYFFNTPIWGRCTHFDVHIFSIGLVQPPPIL